MSRQQASIQSEKAAPLTSSPDTGTGRTQGDLASASNHSETRISSLQSDANTSPSPQTDALKNPPPPSAKQEQARSAGAKQSKNFAHDINYKIDQIEQHVEGLAKQYRTSDSKLRLAIGDIRSRTAVVTSEIDRISQDLQHADTENKTRLVELEVRLKAAVEQLQSELLGLDDRVSGHHASIQTLKTDLNSSYTHLDGKINKLKLYMDAKISALGAQQDAQKANQQTLSAALDMLDEKSNETADALHATQVEQAQQQRLNKKYFTIAVSTLSAAVLLTLGIMSYLHFTKPGTLEASAGIEAPEGTLFKLEESPKQGAQEALLTPQNSMSEAAADAKFSDLERRLAESSKQLALSEQSAANSLEALADKISALQLSIYGPEDGGSAKLAETISLHNTAWLTQQPAEHYSIQLVGLYREEAMINFINRHAGALTQYPVAFNISEYRGKDWYNVMYGSFASFTEAQSVLAGLPSPLQSNAPWIRQMDSVQRTAKP